MNYQLFIVTPAIPEQIYPFTWLTTPDRYLAILNKGTHFSTQGGAKDKGIFPLTQLYLNRNQIAMKICPLKPASICRF